MKFEKFKALEKVKSWKADVAGVVGHIESWKILVKKLEVGLASVAPWQQSTHKLSII